MLRASPDADLLKRDWVGNHYIDQWLPDETLFSVCSRIHTLSGSHRPDSTCLSLFNHPRQGSAHDIPIRVDDFTERTNGFFGDSQSVILERTILPFFLRMAHPELAADSIAIARSSSLGNLKGRLGLLASRFGASHPLRACPDCMQEDREIHHVSYWHRDHQWPGTWMCLKHRTALLRGIGKVNTHGRFHWYLPEEMTLVPPGVPATLEAATATLTKVAECAVALGCGTKQEWLEPVRVQQTYRWRFAELGVLRGSDQIDAKDLQTILTSSLLPLSPIFGFETLAEDQTSLTTQFLRLFRSTRSVGHPLRHILLIVSIFDTWTDFLNAYRLAHQEGAFRSSPGLSEDTTNLPFSPIEQQRQKVLELVQQGNSLTSAASSVGVAVATAMAWLAASGASCRRRPKILTPDRRNLAISRLRRGASKETVAAAISMSTQTITLLLRTEPGLQDAWHTARFKKAQRIARTRWERTAKRLPVPSPKVLREAQPAVFAWLYRNDRAWLVSFAQTLPRLQRSNNVCIRWDTRDVQLAQSVRQVADAFASSHDQTRPRLADLCDAIEALRRRLGHLDRLPLTRAAIREVVRGRFSG